LESRPKKRELGEHQRPDWGKSGGQKESWMGHRGKKKRVGLRRRLGKGETGKRRIRRKLPEREGGENQKEPEAAGKKKKTSRRPEPHGGVQWAIGF